MTAPPVPPEPLMPLLIAAKPGAKSREVLVDEATAERLIRDLTADLEAIRAAKRAWADWTTPRGEDPLPQREPGNGLPYRRCKFVFAVFMGGPSQCVSYEGHGGNHGDGNGHEWPTLASAEPGTVVDATIHEEWCAGAHDDSGPCDPLPRSLGGKRCPAVRMTVTGLVQCEIFAGHAGRHADDDLMDWGELAPSCPDSHPLDGMACERSDGHDGPHRYMPFAPTGGPVVVEWTAADVLAHSIPDQPDDNPCGEAWPPDTSLRCFREPGHHGQHAAAPGPDRQTRCWPNAAEADLAGDDGELPGAGALLIPMRREPAPADDVASAVTQ